MATRMSVPVSNVGVQVTPGSINVLTEVGTDESATDVVASIEALAADPSAAEDLFGAPAVIDTASIETVVLKLPPSPPPPSPPQPPSAPNKPIPPFVVGIIIGAPIFLALLVFFCVRMLPHADVGGPAPSSSTPLLVSSAQFAPTPTKPFKPVSAHLHQQQPLAAQRVARSQKYHVVQR